MTTAAGKIPLNKGFCSPTPKLRRMSAASWSWRDGQALQLQLAEERQRYGKLQQASDSELDTLRQQHHVLQQQLELTTRKLENLTDIERQLSTRKPAGNFSPDTPHEGEKPAPSTHEVTPDEP